MLFWSLCSPGTSPGGSAGLALNPGSQPCTLAQDTQAQMLTVLGGALDRIHHVETEAAPLKQPPSPKETYVIFPPEGTCCPSEHKDKLPHTDIHEQNDRDQGGGTHRQPTTHFSYAPCNVVFQVALGGLDINHT